MPIPQSPDIDVRLATADDAPAIAAVLRAAFAEYDALYTAEALAATTPPSERIEQRMHEGPVWVAVRQNAIVGTVAAVPQSKALYVRSMAVLPMARGQGVGRRLFEQVERYAAARGLTRLYLSTTPFLTRAIRLYEGLGFRRTNAGPNDLFGTQLFTMEKVLPPSHRD